MGTGATYKPVAEAWAVYNEDGVGKPHKSKGRVRFYERDFYSYRTVVAKYMKNAEGKQYVLACSRRYSISTDSHIRIALGKVGNVPSFHVPLLADDEDSRLTNAQYLRSEVVAIADQAVKRYLVAQSDSWWGDYSYPPRLRRAHDIMTRYLAVTGTSLKYMPLDEMLAHVREARQAKLAKFNSPAEVRKRERAHARRLAEKII